MAATATSASAVSAADEPLDTEEDASPSTQDEEQGENPPENNDEKPSKPRQWLIDRMFGKSPPPESKPPCWICYVPPCISIAPDLLEQNICCERCGKVGVVDSELPGIWRQRLMGVGAFVNLVAILLTITSCFCISTNYDILQAMGFSSGEITTTNLTTSQHIDTATVDIGLQAVAYYDPLFGVEEVILFDDFCNYNTSYWAARFIAPSDCTACAEVSDSLIFTLAVSAFPYLPSLISDIIRMYANYDINCMKMFGTVASGVGMALAMYSFLAYRFQCFFSFYEGNVYYDQDWVEVPTAEEAVVQATVTWNPGNGLICIILGTALMGVDIIVNLLVPTPVITRNHEMQEEYEQMALSSSAIPANVSWGGFVDAFCGMICCGTKKQKDDEEEAALNASKKKEVNASTKEEMMDRGEATVEKEGKEK